MTPVDFFVFALTLFVFAALIHVVYADHIAARGIPRAILDPMFPIVVLFILLLVGVALRRI